MTKIILCDEPLLESALKMEVESPKNTLLFSHEELKIEHSHEIIHKASLSGEKCIFIAANFFNEHSQNALLKTLEEPPVHTSFTIFAKGKNYLLKTILSRGIIEDKRSTPSLKEFPLDLKTLSFQSILEFKSTLAEKSREEILELLSCLLFSLKEHTLREKDLERFDLALNALKSYQRPELVITALLLMALRVVRK